MIISVQAKARNCLRDNAAQREVVVIGALKEVLIGMWIRNERRALFRKLWSKIRSFKARQPKCICRNLRIGPAEHFEVEIGNNLCEWNRRIRDELLRAVTTSLLASETDKIDRAARPFACCEHARQFQDCDTT